MQWSSLTKSQKRNVNNIQMYIYSNNSHEVTNLIGNNYNMLTEQK